MKHIEEKDGKVFIDGVEYIPKKYNNELPKCYADIVKKHNYTQKIGYVINTGGVVEEWPIVSGTTGVFFNEKQALAFIKLKNLLELRDEYNDDWKPNFNIALNKWCIGIYINTINVLQFPWAPYSEFIFKSKELATQFLENHREDIEFVFKYLYMWNPKN